MLKEVNATFLVLIPKLTGEDTFGSFKPINLCNSFYKIFAKVLANRLINLLLEIISPQLLGFVLGRKILDSIMEAHEVIHSLEVGKQEGFLLKLYLSKAYNRED